MSFQILTRCVCAPSDGTRDASSFLLTLSSAGPHPSAPTLSVRSLPPPLCSPSPSNSPPQGRSPDVARAAVALVVATVFPPTSISYLLFALLICLQLFRPKGFSPALGSRPMTLLCQFCLAG